MICQGTLKTDIKATFSFFLILFINKFNKERFFIKIYFPEGAREVSIKRRGQTNKYYYMEISFRLSQTNKIEKLTRLLSGPPQTSPVNLELAGGGELGEEGEVEGGDVGGSMTPTSDVSGTEHQVEKIKKLRK